MSNPRISVVIPTYNYGRFVLEAVESALAQTHPALEVIVVNDGSTDDTQNRLQPYLDRIRYIDQDNQGLSAARNTGIKTARGDWVALLDSDDVWHPRKLELQAAYLTKVPGLDLLASGHLEFQGDSRSAIQIPKLPATRPVSFEDLVLRSRFAPSGTIIRKSCFDEVGDFDTSLRSAEDRDMWIRIARRASVVLMTTPLWWYRVHGESMSHASKRMEENENQVLRKVFPTGSRLPIKTRQLQCMAYSIAASSAAYMYDVSGQRWRALHRVAKAFFLWPFPYRRDNASVRFIRPKLLLRITRSLLISSA